MDFFASPDGLDDNAGTFDSPWSLDKGLDSVRPGDVLLLRGGSYRGNTVIRGLSATPEDRIVIRSAPGERAIFEVGLPEFAQAPNDQWIRQGDSDEYVSRTRYLRDDNNEARGSFIDSADGYLRLITHATLHDLQASNERFGPGKVGDSTFPDGPVAVSPDPPHNPLPSSPRRPWVYMGPGLHQDDEGCIHVRLSATTNAQPGFPAYTGESDPNNVPLAIWTLTRATLRIEDCTSVSISDVTVRYGSSTVKLERCTDVRLDHVLVESGSYGVELGPACHGTVLSHCRIDGGMPPWYFRSDRKDEYYFFDAKPDGSTQLVHNVLGANTVRGSIFGKPSCTDTTITYCEFVNGHDLALFGADLKFFRNWIFNINDDALFAEPQDVTNLQIFENVLEQCLMAVSMARKVAGHGVVVYRNLIDLRRPTAKVRPHPSDGPQPLQHGQVFKGNEPDGPIDLFQNTVIVQDQTEESSFAHFRAYQGKNRRRTFNNIFVAVDSVSGSNLPITFLPTPPTPLAGDEQTWPAATDGNCYFRVGEFGTGALLRHRKYDFGDVHDDGRTYDSLTDLRGIPAQPDGTPAIPPSAFFVHSRFAYAPGFERSSIEGDPRFRSFDASSGASSPDDDFRLLSDSPARQAGVVLPAALRVLDHTSAGERPAIGCYRMDAPPLAVGVDGRRQFPGPRAS